MSAEVIYPSFVTALDLPAERVLNGALNANLKSVVVIGYTADDDEYVASSIASGPQVNWLLDRVKYRLMSET